MTDKEKLELLLKLAEAEQNNKSIVEKGSDFVVEGDVGFFMSLSFLIIVLFSFIIAFYH